MSLNVSRGAGGTGDAAGTDNCMSAGKREFCRIHTLGIGYVGVYNRHRREALRCLRLRNATTHGIIDFHFGLE
jgi:hypothetical protein